MMKMIMMSMRMTLPLGVLALTLGGCGKSEAPSEPLQNVEMENEVPAVLNDIEPAPPLVPAANVAEPPAAAEGRVEQDQQLGEDADATGRTSRMQQADEASAETNAAEVKD